MPDKTLVEKVADLLEEWHDLKDREVVWRELTDSLIKHNKQLNAMIHIGGSNLFSSILDQNHDHGS